MPFPVVSYDRDTPAGYPGMVATTEGADADISLVAAAGGGDIAFGSVVVFDVLEGVAKAPTAGGKFAGVVIADRTIPFQNGNVIKPFDQFTAKRAGSIFVTALAAVAQGDPVYFTATGGLTNVATSNTLIPDAEWVIPTTAAGLSRIRLSISK